MINHELKNLFKQNSVHKKFVIDYDGGTITNSDMFMEEFSLEESLCSEEELRFGNCEASVVQFPISNVFTPLNGKVLDVSVVLNHNADKPLKIGKYKVSSDIPTADRKRKDITAYDALYDVINANVADWYNALLPNNDSTVTLKQFRDSFFGYFGIEQMDKSLVNDNMIVTKTIQPTELSGSVVVNAICELNGCFGHINRDGLMDYVFLEKSWASLYPADDLYPENDLFPREGKMHKYSSSDYQIGDCDYEDYVSRKITGLEIRQAENSIGAFVGERENPYIVSDNFLTFGKSTEEMATIAQNMFGVIKDIEYRPFTLNTFRGNPCAEVGDGITIYTNNQIVESYILNRTLTGIQALTDSFEAKGKEYHTEKLNGVQSQIAQLKGKANILERTIGETSSRIVDLEKNTETEIRQLADSVAISVDADGNLVTDLTLNKNGISFVGNYIVISANNFSLDENGEVMIRGVAHLDNGLSVYIPEYTKVSGYKFDAGYYNVVKAGKNSVKMGVLDSGDGTSSYMDFDREGFATLYANGQRVFHANEYGLFGTLFFDVPIGATKGVIGNIQCLDNSYRPSIGSLSNEYAIAYISSKPKDEEKNAWFITVNGKWGASEFASHNIYSGSSDVRLKENIENTKINNAIEIIEKIKVREFDWKNNGGHQKIGFVADELEEIDKSLAFGGGYEENGTPNYKTVNGFYLQGYEIKAIQELSQENRELKSEIDKLKKSVSFLMEKLGGMSNE